MDQNLEEVVVRHLKDGGLKLAVAESSTGGLICSRLTSIAGVSDVFLGGFIAYSNDMKIRLGVPAQFIKKYGAVSKEVAARMALKTLEQTGSDLALSVTGIAGPKGATVKKPLGLHFIGLAQTNKPVDVKQFIFKGSRRQIQRQASQQALLFLKEALL